MQPGPHYRITLLNRSSVTRSELPIQAAGLVAERVCRAQRLVAKIDAIATSGGDRDRTSRIRTRGNARKLRAICRRPENIGSHRTGWWAREDSNLQPDRYERSARGSTRARSTGVARKSPGPTDENGGHTPAPTSSFLRFRPVVISPPQLLRVGPATPPGWLPLALPFVLRG